jgi:hypothetical protein
VDEFWDQEVDGCAISSHLYSYAIAVTVVAVTRWGLFLRRGVIFFFGLIAYGKRQLEDTMMLMCGVLGGCRCPVERTGLGGVQVMIYQS